MTGRYEDSRSGDRDWWIEWAGVVPGDHVLTGSAGAGWAWWEVLSVGSGEWKGWVQVKGASGVVRTGQVDLTKLVRVRPAAGARGDELDMAAAQQVCNDLLGTVVMSGSEV